MPIDESVLLDALKSTDERTRTLAVWHVALAVVVGDGFSDEVLKAVAPAATPPGGDVLFLFDAPMIACADAPRAPRALRVSDFKAAVAKKRVPYEWSPAMRRLQIDGVVRLSATVTQTGCVRYVETKRSLDPIYDLATIQALTQWQYTPATADGTPVESRASAVFDVTAH